MLNVVLVDEKDHSVGVMEKLEAHQKGILHRAFSVMLYRHNQETQAVEVLLQQRALGKYHGGGLWANTCCSHPEAGESVIQGAYRRLGQEVFPHQPEWLDQIKLKQAGSFTYRAELDQGLIEHEFDHVFVGEYPSERYGELPDFNQDEMDHMEWVALSKLKEVLGFAEHLNKLNIDAAINLEVIEAGGRKYAPWLILVCEKVSNFLDF
jgi:isopentenyl-diphosphate delta-isomerase